MDKNNGAKKRLGKSGRSAAGKRKLVTALVAVGGSVVLFLLFLLVWDFFDEDFDWQRFVGLRAVEETQPTEETVTAGTPDDPFSDADALTFFVTLDDRKDLGYASLISFSSKEMSVKIKPLPLDLKLTVSGREGTLSSLFPDFGAVGLKGAVEEKFGVGVRYYLSLSAVDFKKLCESVGETEVRFDRPTGEFNDNAIKYSFKRGKYPLGADALYAVLLHAYPGEEGVAFSGSVTADFLSQHLTTAFLADGEAAFNSLVNLATTDLNSSFYDAYKQKITDFFTGNPTYDVTG